MIFGDRQSESPRVPSPWTYAQQRASSPRAPPKLATEANPETPPFGSISVPKDNFINASGYSPLSRAVLCGDGITDGQSASVHLSARDVDESRNDSLTSTPPTEEDDDDVADGFFALDTDLDVMNLGGSSPAPEDDLVEKQRVSSDVVAKAVQALAPRSGHRPTRLAPEPDLAGNLEYKLRILPPTRHRYDKLLTQLQWRLLQGGGECTYEIGVLDDGLCIGLCSLEMRASLCMLASMAAELDAVVRISKAFVVVSSPEKLSDPVAAASELRTMSSIDATAALLAPLGGTNAALCSCGQSARQLNDAMAYVPRSGDSSDAASKADCASALTELIAIGIALSDDGQGNNVGSFLVQVQPDDVEQNSGKGSSSDCAGSEEGGGTDSPLDTVPAILCNQEDDEQQDLTFSLSLDETATRSGFGFRRPRTEQRRASRYSPKNAAASLRQRVSLAVAQQAGGGNVGGAESPSAGRRARAQSPSRATKSSARTIDEADAVGGAPHYDLTAADGSPLPTCVRLIVEATVLRADSESKAFIDYSSL